VTPKPALHGMRHVCSRLLLHGEELLYSIWMTIRNVSANALITSPEGPVVCLTTYGARITMVHLAIESIARGSMLPSRLILWIDDASAMQHLPPGLRRLQKRGLEVRLCRNYGSHKKYYPYLESLQDIDVPLVTADDDLLYPRSWLKRLYEAYLRYPNVVNCHRARVIQLKEGRLIKYEQWDLANSSQASLLHVAGSGAGAIYPIPLQLALKRQGTGFLHCCPKADDIWLHVQALRAGYRVRQIDTQLFRIREIPGTQVTALCHDNVTCGGNDRQIALTYTAMDIRIMSRAAVLPSQAPTTVEDECVQVATPQVVTDLMP